MGDGFNMINRLTLCQKWSRFFFKKHGRNVNPTTAKRDQNLISLYRKTAQANIKVVERLKNAQEVKKCYGKIKIDTIKLPVFKALKSSFKIAKQLGSAVAIDKATHSF